MKQCLYLFTLLLLFSHSELVASETPHDNAEIRCLDCHVNLPLERVVLSFYNDTPSICLRCHQNYPCRTDTNTKKGYIHPVDMVPTMTVPDDLVLDRQGQISCITCHFYHDKGKAALALHRHYLRRSTVKRLCMSCHRKI
jgi:Cytochrome c3